jgi:hypothetical protein
MATLYLVVSEAAWDLNQSEILFNSFSKNKAENELKKYQKKPGFSQNNFYIKELVVPELEQYCGSPLTVDRCVKCVDTCERKYLRLKE